MAATGTPAAEYLGLLAARAAQVLDQGRSAAYPRSLTAVTQLAFDRLRGEDPAAAELAAICAFLAPEPVPADWFPARRRGASRAAGREGGGPDGVAAGAGPGPAAGAGPAGPARAADAPAHPGDPARLPAARAGGRDPGRGGGGAGRQPPRRRGAAVDLARVGAAAAAPARPGPGDQHGGPADLTYDAAWYLIRRGDARGGYDLARRLYQHRLDELGPDDPDTLNAAATLAAVLRALGRYDQARELDEDTLARGRRVLGEDHPDTLISANNLALDLRALGDHQAARELDEDTLARHRRVLGDDHPGTLASASNLAIDLADLGDHQAARELDEDTLAPAAASWARTTPTP